MHDLINEEKISIYKAAKLLGFSKGVIDDWIDEGRIECQDGLLRRSIVEKIIEEKSQYVALETFLKDYNSDRFDSKCANHRHKYDEYIDEHGYFGIKVYTHADMQFPILSKESKYFESKDLEKLKNHSVDFFKTFGLNEKEICTIILDECKYVTTQKLLLSFMEKVEKYTPAVTSFVKETSKIDVNRLENSNLDKYANRMAYETSKELFSEFIGYVNTVLHKDIGRLDRKKRHTTKDIGAYPYSTFLTIARAVFNENYIADNNVVRKSLDSSYVCETWLFLSAFYVCDWRGIDIGEVWPYIDETIADKNHISLSTLKEDMLNGNIKKQTYIEIGAYLEKSIELLAMKPGKTNTGEDLIAPMTDGLKEFFGRIALIMLYHNINSNGKEGRMKTKRQNQYLNYERIRSIFGDSIFNVMGYDSIEVRRMNKSYTQSILRRASKNGAGMLTAYAIAALARSHKDIDTTAIYIMDGGLTGETEDVVLELLFERGVFGVIKYNECMAITGGAFKALSPQEQTEEMARISSSAYQMEIIGAGILGEYNIRKYFENGDKERTLKTLNMWLEIAQNFGKAKEEGIYCVKRALGEACVHPEIKSCLANVCPYLIFSEKGIRSLVNVMYEYKERAETTGNPKYYVMLEDDIKPAYKDIVFELSKKLDPDENEALKEAIRFYMIDFKKYKHEVM